MSIRSARLPVRHLVISLIAIVGASVGFAADPTTSSTAPSKETREKMATLHEQMAACLRSEKPIADCHTEAMQHCQAIMGKEGCPMNMMGMGGGMHSGQMMQGQPPKSGQPK
jgi:hypothetical protein